MGILYGLQAKLARLSKACLFASQKVELVKWDQIINNMGMDDQTITKLIGRMTQIFVTKDDLKNLTTKKYLNNLKIELKADIRRVENEVKSVGQTLVDFIDEIDPKLEDHEKRLQKIESQSSVAQ
jgi:hypothetical protein